jgi:hypothetical protein
MAVSRKRRGRALIIAIEREDRPNALNAEVTPGLDAAMNELEDTSELWCERPARLLRTSVRGYLPSPHDIPPQRAAGAHARAHRHLWRRSLFPDWNVSGKAKRLPHTAAVEIAPSTFTGRLCATVFEVSNSA